jgi:hypothetical protein
MTLSARHRSLNEIRRRRIITDKNYTYIAQYVIIVRLLPFRNQASRRSIKIRPSNPGCSESIVCSEQCTFLNRTELSAHIFLYYHTVHMYKWKTDLKKIKFEAN